MKISMIAAVAANGVIGKDNDLAWRLPDDMRYFKDQTKGKVVIMGRKNWESLPPKWRPLPGRPNIVITRQDQYDAPGATVVNTLDAALLKAKEQAGDKEIFIIGGGQIYKMGFSKADYLYLTEIEAEPEGDTYFPDWDRSAWDQLSRHHHEIDDKHQYAFDFVIYKRKPN